MSRKSRSSYQDGLVQTDIFSSITNLKRLSSKQKALKSGNTKSPVVIDLDLIDSDDDNKETAVPATTINQGGPAINAVKKRLSFTVPEPEDCKDVYRRRVEPTKIPICVNKPSTGSTSNNNSSFNSSSSNFISSSEITTPVATSGQSTIVQDSSVSSGYVSTIAKGNSKSCIKNKSKMNASSSSVNSITGDLKSSVLTTSQSKRNLITDEGSPSISDNSVTNKNKPVQILNKPNAISVLDKSLGPKDVSQKYPEISFTPIKTSSANINVQHNIVVSPSTNNTITNDNSGISCNQNSTEQLTETPKKRPDVHKVSNTLHNKSSSSVDVTVADTTKNVDPSTTPRRKIEGPIEKGTASTSGTPKKSNPSPKSPCSSISSPRRGSAKKEERGINHNFLNVINELMDSVSQSRYLQYVLREDNDLLNVVKSCSAEYQYVCFKLYMWQPKWYNLFDFCNRINSNLTDKEVVELFEFLKNNNIVETDYSNEDLELLLNLLHLSKIKCICEKFKIRKASKTTMIQVLLNNCKKQSTLTLSKSTKDLVLEEVVKQLGKTVVKINEAFRKSFFHLYLLGTFTNPLFYDRKEFFRSMLEFRIDFPDFETVDHIVFYTRAEFLSYARSREYRDRYEELIKSKDHIQLLQMGKDILNILKDMDEDDEDDNRYRDAPHLKMFTAKSVYTSTLTKIISFVRVTFYHDVKVWLEYLIVKFPKSHKLCLWYLDLIQIYVTLKDPDAAAKTLIDALNEKKSYMTEVEIQTLGEKGEQLKTRCNQLLHDCLTELVPVPIHLDDFPQVTEDAKTVRGNVSGHKRHYEVQNEDGSKTFKSVEQTAMDFYFRCGYTDGDHCEGSMIMALFTLFFWDIIYAPEIFVPGSFLSKLQQYPLDMHTPYFYSNRKRIIDKRLKDIAEDWTDDETLKFVAEHYSSYSHKSGLCTVDNTIPDRKILKIIVSCIGRTTLSKIFERLVKDERQFRSGMPDLLVWNEKEEKAKFVEVKGENDKLSVKQKLWLKYLQSVGANIEVCHVHSIGSKKKLKPVVKDQEGNSSSKKMANKTLTKKARTPKTVKDKRSNYRHSSSDFSDSETYSSSKNSAKSSIGTKSPSTSQQNSKKVKTGSSSATAKRKATTKDGGKKLSQTPVPNTSNAESENSKLSDPGTLCASEIDSGSHNAAESSVNIQTPSTSRQNNRGASSSKGKRKIPTENSFTTENSSKKKQKVSFTNGNSAITQHSDHYKDKLGYSAKKPSSLNCQLEDLPLEEPSQHKLNKVNSGASDSRESSSQKPCIPANSSNKEATMSVGDINASPAFIQDTNHASSPSSQNAQGTNYTAEPMEKIKLAETRTKMTQTSENRNHLAEHKENFLPPDSRNTVIVGKSAVPRGYRL